MDLEPYCNFEGLADQISLEKNLPCSFTFGEMKFNTEAEIVLDTDWSADIRTEIPISFEDYMSLLSSPFRTDQIFLNGQKISVFISGLSSSSPGKAIINFTPTEEPFQIIGNNETRLSKVIFHLCNFKDRFGTSRKVIRLENSGYSLGITELITAEWKVELHESKKLMTLINRKVTTRL